MISDYRCFFCFTRAFEPLLEKDTMPPEGKQEFTREMAALFSRLCGVVPAPVISSEIHAEWRKHSGNDDPYLELKQRSNELVMSLYPAMKQMVEQSPDPFDKAVRLAVAGNIIDYGACQSFDLHATIDHVLRSHFAIDHTARLQQELAKAKRVLYLGDNSGEIVFDKLLIETLGRSDFYFAVRGAAVINDATIVDAISVGIDNVATLIDNGYDAPSTIIDYCSDEFRGVFDSADLVISKGQGNFEGLYGMPDKNIFFLLMVKCNVVAEELGVKKGDFVVVANNSIPSKKI